MRFREEAQQNIHQHVYEIIWQQIKGCTTCVSYAHEKKRYETTKISTGRKNRYEMNWPLWWNRGATTTTDTICADNLNVDAWLIAKKRIHHNNVGTIWRRLIAWIEMHTETPNLTFNKCIDQTTRTGGEISHKEYGYREVREADDKTTTKRTQTNETVERRG